MAFATFLSARLDSGDWPIPVAERVLKMNHPLKEVLELLRELRQQMHDDANASVTEQLDEAIRLVENCRGSEEGRMHKRLLDLLGQILIALPSISRILESFRD